MILYYVGKEIVEYPVIRKAQYYKDFYFGFYCTRFLEQAKRWASRYGIEGYLNFYEYTPNYELPVCRKREWRMLFSFFYNKIKNKSFTFIIQNNHQMQTVL